MTKNKNKYRIYLPDQYYRFNLANVKGDVLINLHKKAKKNGFTGIGSYLKSMMFKIANEKK